MLKKRLLLAKRLLAADGILIVAIDDDEMPHLCVMLRTMFAAYTMQPIVVRHHPQGSGGDNVSIVHEYAIVVIPSGRNIFRGKVITAESEFWPAMKTGAGRDYFRVGRPSMFYAVLVDPITDRVMSVGPELGLNDKYPTGKTSEGWLRIYPFDQQKRERRWRCGRTKMLEYIRDGLVEFSPTSSGIRLKKQRAGNTSPTFSIWDSPAYNAGPHGTAMLGAILGDSSVFSFPKSVYAVRDMLACALRLKPKDSLVLDFFAGSGTTLHGLLLCNAADGGIRRSILVTNNEVDEATADRLRKESLFPGDAEFERFGIAEKVAWPRCRNIIQGSRQDGAELPGNIWTDRRSLMDSTRTWSISGSIFSIPMTLRAETHSRPLCRSSGW